MRATKVAGKPAPHLLKIYFLKLLCAVKLPFRLCQLEEYSKVVKHWYQPCGTAILRFTPIQAMPKLVWWSTCMDTLSTGPVVLPTDLFNLIVYMSQMGYRLKWSFWSESKSSFAYSFNLLLPPCFNLYVPKNLSHSYNLSSNPDFINEFEPYQTIHRLMLVGTSKNLPFFSLSLSLSLFI